MASPDPVSAKTAHPADLTGRTIGRFDVRARIGAGGMGEVYRAEDTLLKRTVALKRVAPDLRRDSRYTQRLQREAQLASGLNSPHIAAIYDVFEAGGEILLVMEFVEGTNLRYWMLRPLDLNEFLRMAVQCAAALEAAQGKGIVHGDIKPENIMVTPNSQVKVLDFGVAKRLPTSDTETFEELFSATATLGGTPAYMAPEVLQRRNPDARADIYSLGVVFYEALSGHHPFEAHSSSAASMAGVPQEIPAPLSESNSKLPGELDRILAKMLAKDPADRYATAADLVVDLRAVQRQSTSTARQPLPRPGPVRASLWWRLLTPVAIAVVLLAAAAVFHWPKQFFGGVAPPKITSLAVLPLENLSGDPAQEYFADGMTEALIAELSQFSSLRVISRTSVMQYKGTHGSVPDIARNLHVDALIEGSVARSGDQVEIRAGLIQASPERLLWSRPYQSSQREILALQREVARSIALAIDLKLTAQEQARLTTRQQPTVNPDAYDAYLKGRDSWNQRTEESLKKSLDYFQRAVDLDPAYARAFAGLADTYATLGNNRFLSPGVAFPKAKAAAQKALELDDNLAEAHASLAFAVWNYDFDWDLVEREYKRAIELNPGYATAYHWYAGYLSGMGRHREAIAAILKARELDPLSSRINANVGFILYFAREYDRAIEELQKASAMDPASGATDLYLGMAYLQKGNYPQALEALERNARIPDSPAASALDLAYGYAVAGRREQSRKMLRQLLAQQKQTYLPALWVARVYTALDEKEDAFIWLRRAYDERSSQLPFLNVDPRLDPLRSDPRFQALLRQMKLKPEPAIALQREPFPVCGSPTPAT